MVVLLTAVTCGCLLHSAVEKARAKQTTIVIAARSVHPKGYAQ
jgi:hypothetical protein